MPGTFMGAHHIPMVITSTQQPKGEDMFDTSQLVSDVFAIGNYGAFVVIVTKLAGAVGTGTFGIEACDDTTPTTSPAITGGWWFRYQTTPDTFSAWELETDASTTITAGSDSIWEFYVPVSALRGGTSQYEYKYARWSIAEVDSTAVDGATVTMLVEPRIAAGNPPVGILG